MAEGKNEKFICEVEDANKSYGIGIRHLQVGCLWLSMMTLFMARSSMGVAVLAMSGETNNNGSDVTVFDWDKQTQSVVLSSFFWGYLVMQIPAGILAKRYGGKPIMFVALLVNATMCLLTPTLASLGGWQVVCALRGIMGLSQACLFPVSQTLLGQWLPPKEHSKYTGIVFGGSQLGIIIMMPLSGFLAGTVLGWKMIFYALSGILLPTAALWYVLAASNPGCHRLISAEERFYIESHLNLKGSKKAQRIPWKAILTSKPFWGTLAPHYSFAMSYVLFFVDLPTFLEKGLRLSFNKSATLSALPYIGMWMGVTTSGIISEKLINLKIISLSATRKIFESIALFGTALGLIVLSFIDAGQKTIAVIILVIIMTINGNTSAGHFVNQLDLSPNYAGLIMSLANFAASAGSVAVPLITGLVLGDDTTDVSRWGTVFLLHAGNNIICNVIFLVLGTAERQEWDDCDYLEKETAKPEEIKVLHKSQEEEAAEPQ